MEGFTERASIPAHYLFPPEEIGGLGLENLITTPCFTPGTLIATARGQVAVEQLGVGDKIVTRDNGLQPIRWIGRRSFSHADLNAHAAIQPIFIRRDAFGPGRPTRDMIVSPEHRMLVQPHHTFINVSEEMLIAARHVVDNRTVFPARMLGVTYWHILCSRHQVILGNGTWTETFHPDDQVLKGMAQSQRIELTSMFPEIKTMGAAAAFPPARKILRRSLAGVFRG